MSWLRSEELRRGLSAENIIADLLATYVNGLQILQVVSAAGARRGPRVRSPDFGDLMELPAHDIKAWFADVHFDIQVKLKREPSWRHVAGCYEHGFDLPVYYGYQHIYEFSATRCLLLIIEEAMPRKGPGASPRVLANWLHRTPPHRIDKEPKDHAPYGFAYWGRDQFIPIMDASMSPYEFIRNERGEPLIQKELRNEFLMRKKPSIQRPLTLPRAPKLDGAA